MDSGIGVDALIGGAVGLVLIVYAVVFQRRAQSAAMQRIDRGQQMVQESLTMQRENLSVQRELLAVLREISAKLDRG
jgi:hypothetical protein